MFSVLLPVPPLFLGFLARVELTQIEVKPAKCFEREVPNISHHYHDADTTFQTLYPSTPAGRANKHHSANVRGIAHLNAATGSHAIGVNP